MNYNLGRVLPIFRGTYDNTTQYTNLDVVYFNGSSYVATGDTVGNTPTDTEHWVPVAMAGTLSPEQVEAIQQEVIAYVQAQGYVIDANYVHTDNNFTNAEKSKLDGIDMSTKQDTLVSGQNIATINGNNLLEGGNIVIQTGGGSGGTTDYTQLSNLPSINGTTLTGNVSLATPEQLAAKQDTLVSGTNIKTINGEPILGSGNITIQGGEGGGTVIDSLDSTSATSALSANQGRELNEQYNIKSEISLDNSVEGYYIENTGTQRGASASRSIAYFNIEGTSKIRIVVPKTGNNYACVFAFCNTNTAASFTAPTNIVSVVERVNYTQDIDLSVENSSGKKYIAITFTTSNGNPQCYSLKDYVFKEDINEINEDINAIETQLEIVDDVLGREQIALDTSYTLKYIAHSSSPYITTSGSSSIAYFYIKDKHNLIVHIPKCGNEYTQCYAYSETIKQSGALVVGESIIQGNSSTKDFIAENSSNCNYLVLCYIPGSGLPTVSEPSTMDNLIGSIDELSDTDKRIIDSMAANKKSDVCDKVRPLKVLFVANSFAVQATQRLPEVFSKIGYNIIIGVSYLGGATVSQYDSLKESTTNTQYVKYNGIEWVYEGLQTSNLSVYDPSHTYTTVEGNNHCKYDVNGGTNYVAYRCIQETTGTFDPSCWVRATKSNTLIDKLNDENWDVVFFIQGSASAGSYSTYEPYFTSLLNWLPKRIQSLGYKVGWFMPWAWDDAKISTDGGNLDGGTNNAEMFANICNATQSNITNHEIEITFFCPCGTATENQLNYYTQSQIWADGQHTNVPGFYPATLVLFDRLANYFCKTGLNELSYSSGIGVGTEEAFNNAKTSALNAISTPYEMTVIE